MVAKFGTFAAVTMGAVVTASSEAPITITGLAEAALIGVGTGGRVDHTNIHRGPTGTRAPGRGRATAGHSERRGRSDREPGRDLSEQCLHWHLPITWNAPQPTDAGKATAVRNPVHPRAQADRSGHSAVEGLALLLEEMIVMIIGCMRQGPGCQ